jgi:Hypothetical protein (DUF2513)
MDAQDATWAKNLLRGSGLQAMRGALLGHPLTVASPVHPIMAGFAFDHPTVGNMKRDEDLIIRMLIKLEAFPSGGTFRIRPDDEEIAVQGYSDREILDHFQHLIDQGLVKNGLITPDQEIEFERLSSKGHDFLKTKRG